jgi:hypothetical protein
MRRFSSTEEVQAAKLPPWQHEAVSEAVEVMEDIFGSGFDLERGFVVLVEEGDTPETVEPESGLSLQHKGLECTWRRHGCLVGLVLWGNSGDGVSVVCPERPGYADEVQEVLRQEL